MDFTIYSYEKLLKALLASNYRSVSFLEYLEGHASKKVVLLRHDTEYKYNNALKLARIQHKYGVKATYFFRIIPKSFDKAIVKEIANLGHEIGYHYDDLVYCKGDYEKAIKRFESNLQILREIAPVKTICMEGSPLSSFDNKDLWKKFKYHDYGIVGDPYLDLNFDKILYLTDTGRRWDGWKLSVKDKVPQQKEWAEQGLIFHTTNDIINAAKKGILPMQTMFTFHPQRWSDKRVPWLRELFWQNLKNVGKRVLISSQK